MTLVAQRQYCSRPSSDALLTGKMRGHTDSVLDSLKHPPRGSHGIPSRQCTTDRLTLNPSSASQDVLPAWRLLCRNPNGSWGSADLPEGEEPRLQLLIRRRDAPLPAEVFLLPLPHEPFVVNNADLVKPPFRLGALPPAIPHLLPGVVPVPLLHCPQQLTIWERPVLPEFLLPPLAGPQHRVPVGLVVVLTRPLRVALQGDRHEDVPAGHPDKLGNDLIGLLGVDVLKHIGTEHHVERVVFVGEVCQDAWLHVALLQHVRALLLQDGARKLDPVSVLPVLTKEAH
mmetsp:Transcript_18579/g.44421  ORF Transcript_18579/g.44421 Transcript_18579/m.44421 type:complete len:285 (-) Transcript_18579:551-1405(-)